MLPISLKVSNFLCYREDVPVLQLQGVHVACLCGGNGHGKSALLDAITWALWGKARGQRHEQLLHQGRLEMNVELEFEARGRCYQVRRRYSKGRTQGVSSLELSVQDQDVYRPITGDTIVATQVLIQQLINMDYDTFVNTSFLLQGRADLFTRATPSQRKEVLGKVLGLGFYERLEDRAKIEARRLQSNLETGLASMEELEKQVGFRPDLLEAQQSTEAELDSAETSLKSLEGRLNLLREKVGYLERLQEEQLKLDEQKRKSEVRKNEAISDLNDLQLRLKVWQETLEMERVINEGYLSFINAKTRMEELDRAFQEIHSLEQLLAVSEQRIAVARATLEGEVVTKEHYIRKELTPRIELLPDIESAIKDYDFRLEELGSKEKQIEFLRAKNQEVEIELQRIEEESAGLEQLGKDTGSKLQLLVHGHAKNAECPLCGTLLDIEARERLSSKYDIEINLLRVKFKEGENRKAILKTEINRLGIEITTHRNEESLLRRRMEAEQERLRVQRDEAREAQIRVEGVQSEIAAVRERLQSGRYLESEQTTAIELRSKIAAIGYSPEGHSLIRAEVESNQKWEKQSRRLEEAKNRIGEDKVGLERVTSRIDEAEREINDIEKMATQFTQELIEISDYQVQLRQVEATYQEASGTRNLLQERRGSLAHQREELDKAETALEEQRGRHNSLATQVGLYLELAQSFGKGGVQALLIEAAIPRLEEEANKLLTRMTDGRMSLRLETQRQRRSTSAAKSRDGIEPIETLEIVIADELGTRAYEMFSGGEGFRVDFAVRIALSKVLAWRAGAPLPTLFIDEGFGTQDSEGRDRILDVIKSIEPDFQRIIVITHMEDIKETFPLRIEVMRTPTGSTFSIS